MPGKGTSAHFLALGGRQVEAWIPAKIEVPLLVRNITLGENLHATGRGEEPMLIACDVAPCLDRGTLAGLGGVILCDAEGVLFSDCLT